MSNTDIVIIGAGAAGLRAARLLAESGKKVIVLEARTRYGGRTYTTHSVNGTVIELGAEFIHGDLPVTQQLLNEAGIPYYLVQGKFMSGTDGKFEEDGLINEHLLAIMERLSQLKEDIDIQTFLETEFPGDEYIALRLSTLAYIESYEAADTSYTSSLALYAEWQQGDENMYRIKGGYGALMDSLYKQCLAAGCQFDLATEVQNINYEKHRVTIKAKDGQQYTAGKCIVTVPLGVLKLEAGKPGHIEFTPAIDDKLDAAKMIGFGSATRFLLLFKEPFWVDYRHDMSFLFSQEEVAVWWTQLPTENNLLVGWTAGPRAIAKKDTSDEELLHEAIASLANIFSKSTDEIRELLEEWTIANWANEPYSYGAYAYASMNANQYKTILKEPILNTLYFAGEGIYTGDATGTVEAALASGQEVAERIFTQGT